MTLLRQLTLVIITLFVLLFAGSFWISVNNTRTYLNNQLRTISQDTATSLGLTLSPHVAAGELVVAESMINAMSDSGYYREVVLSDVDGHPLVKREQAVLTEGVPQWFIERFPLASPVGEGLVMAGWRQAGTVRVSASPGYAYAALWQNTLDAFWWFLGACSFLFVLFVIALRFILKPLRAVEAQARAICDREYLVQERLPWTIELRSVVDAMNRMATKVKHMFEEQADAIERLRAESYQDTLTGLANRRYFDMELALLMESHETPDSGALLFLEIKDFKSFNERKGFQAGDELLRGVARLAEDVARRHRRGGASR